MRRNRVQGPSSALSSFLRERGITVPTTNTFERLAARDPEQAVETDTNAQDSTNSITLELELQSSETIINVQLGLEEVSNEAINTANITLPVGSKSFKKKRSESPDQSSKRSKHTKKTNANAAANNNPSTNLEFCTRCQRRFIKESTESQCTACTAINTNVPRPTNPASKRMIKKRELDSFAITGVSNITVMCLRDMCIKSIAENIANINELGVMYLTSDTKTRISRIISKLRQLTNETVGLFVGSYEDELNLFDCTRLDAEGYATIANYSPNLQILNMTMCGRLTDVSLELLGNRCPLINRLKLSGPFLCTDTGFNSLFRGVASNLTVFHIEHAAKASNIFMEGLVQSCEMLQDISICNSPRIDGDGVSVLSKLKCLKRIGLDNIGIVENGQLCGLINIVGTELEHLSLIGHKKIIDETLVLIASKCKKLKSITLKSCAEIKSEAFSLFFQQTFAFTSINIAQNFDIKDDALLAIALNHAKSLVSLNINGLDELTSDSVNRVAKECTKIVDIDVSWVRAVNDEILKMLFTCCTKLKTVKVFGCHSLNSAVLNTKMKNSDDEWIRVFGNEFD